MVKFYESKATYYFKWDQVAQGFWRRYPNPHSTHVLSEDTVCREVRGDKLFTKRLLTKTSSVPKWAERFVDSSKARIIEESVVDPKSKTLTTYTRNISHTKYMNVIEKVVYTVSEENPNWTEARRYGWIESNYHFVLKHAIQAYGLERFRKNCAKMALGFNYILQSMFPQANGLAEQNTPKNSVSVQTAQKVTQAAREKIRSAAERATTLTTPIYASIQQD